MEVLGLDHIDLTVTDMDRSIQFYDSVLGTLGFSRISHVSYVAWSNGRMNIGLRQADKEQMNLGFNRYRAGLHHFALRAKSRGQVDDLHQYLMDRGERILDPPAEYPEYGIHYYSLFFADPDGLKLEYLHFPWGYWRKVQTDGFDPRPRCEAEH
ncbi:MAG: VOC family protein [SAR324 cluster bacterium]|nr:VOC family protein [SAR324 cluster bacterium]